MPHNAKKKWQQGTHQKQEGQCRATPGSKATPPNSTRRSSSTDRSKSNGTSFASPDVKGTPSTLVEAAATKRARARAKEGEAAARHKHADN